MKIEIRPEIGIPMSNCAAEKKKMEVIGCELQSKMHSWCRTQLFEKTQRFYIAKVNFNAAIYYRVTKSYCKNVGKDSWERQQL